MTPRPGTGPGRVGTVEKGRLALVLTSAAAPRSMTARRVRREAQISGAGMHAEWAGGTPMKALVVYESLWGNTAAIARAIAVGGPDARAVRSGPRALSPGW